MKTLTLWNPETGITDLPDTLKTRQAEELQSVKINWQNLQEKLKSEGLFDVFIERMKRDWAIETGLIERLYSLTRGMTQTYIEYGFKEGLLKHGTHDKSEAYILALARDQKNAMEMVFQAIKEERPFSTSFIKELHAAFTRSQEDVEAQDSAGNLIKVALKRGEWKAQPNFPVRDGVKFLYCPPEQTASEMDRLVAYFEAHKSLAPEVRTAFLHHRFTVIHPFQDGNGRVSRAIASLILVKEGLFPLHVREEKQGEYISVLEEADKGDLTPFVDFIVGLQMEEYLKAEGLYYELRKEGVEELEAKRNEYDKVICDFHRIEYDLRNKYTPLSRFLGLFEIKFPSFSLINKTTEIKAIIEYDDRLFEPIEHPAPYVFSKFTYFHTESNESVIKRFERWLEITFIEVVKLLQNKDQQS